MGNWKLKIKHNNAVAVIPLTIRYTKNDGQTETVVAENVKNTEFSEVDISTFEEDGKVDISRISIDDTETAGTVYNVRTLTLNSDAEAPSADGSDTSSDNTDGVVIPSTVTTSEYQRAVVDGFESGYVTGNLNTAITELILADPNVLTYDLSEQYRYLHTNNPGTYADPSTRGPVLTGGIIMQKTATGYRGKVAYGSLYFNNTLLAANSQYLKIKAYALQTIALRCTNEEEKQNGASSYGYMGSSKNNPKDNRLFCKDLAIPGSDYESSEIYDLASGDTNDATSFVLTVAFTPDFIRSNVLSTGRFKIDGVYQGPTSDVKYARFRLKKGVTYQIEGVPTNADERTYGIHNVLVEEGSGTAFYSDNILKIVTIFGAQNIRNATDKGFNANVVLYQQAIDNFFGIPDGIITKNLDNWAWAKEYTYG